MNPNEQEDTNGASTPDAQQHEVTLTLAQFTQWLEGYFAAWRSNDAEDVKALFAEDAIYQYGPFEPPTVGRQAIVDAWVADPGQQRDIQTSYEPLAVSRDLGIAHWRVTFRRAKDLTVLVEADGILVIRFDQQLRCTEHREWLSLRETP